MGVAATFAIEASSIDDARLATAAGVAALWACEAVGERGMLGMRWPNDLVERRNLKRKVAGVLIERVGTTALVGVGINVTQHEHDWPEELRGSAVSLAQLGIVTSRITVIEALVIAMDRALTTPVSELIATWKDVETLIGTQQEFLSDGRAYRGTVLDIEPMHTIRVRLSDASIHSLPALSTSMVHPVPGPEGR
jgi:biotin-(acetyl-CoA carboxylase) ligase